MKFLSTIICVIFAISVNAQRFDWVSFTPTITGNGNDGSGGQAIASDDDGFLYTVSYFTVPMIIGNDTLQPVNGVGTATTIIIKWNQQGEPVQHKLIAAGGNGIFPFDIAFDEVSEQIIVTFYMQGPPINIVGDTILNTPGTVGSLIRFNKNLNYVSDFTLINTYNSPLAVKDGFVYSAHGYTSVIRKLDANNNVIWSVTSSQGPFNITSMVVGPDNYLYVAGYSMNNIINIPITLGGITINTPTTGNATHTCIFKLDTAGNVLAGTYVAECHSYGYPVNIDVDDDSNIYFAAPYNIGGQTIGNITMTNNNIGVDAFVLKMDSLFQPLWITELQDTGGGMETRGIMMHPSGKLMLTGLYGGNATFGSYTLDPSTFGTGFLVQLNPSNGSILYAENYGSLQGTGRPFDFVSIGNKYYFTGLNYVAGPNTGKYGCYTDTYTSFFLTCFNDTAFAIPAVSLQFNIPDLVATSNVPNAVYTWFLDGTVIPGVTGNTITPLVNGTYSVSVSDYGCEAFADTTITNVGLNEMETEGFVLYPNPASQTLHLQIDQHVNEVMTAEILDVSGKLMYSAVPATHHHTFHIGDLSPGVYSIRVHTTSGTHHKRFVKL